jgi:type IV secretory pathway TrbL component
MLRASLALLLLALSAAVFAQNGRTTAGNASTCQDIADRIGTERTATDRTGDALPVAAEARRARATAIRSKYAGPSALAPSAARSGGGGDDDDSPLPRSRGSKWHSFLPGMFR